MIVADVEHCVFLQGSEDLRMYRKMRIRSMQTTPLRTREDKMVGMISTHRTEAHAPSARSLQLLDILARQAADLIERTRAETWRHQDTAPNK